MERAKDDGALALGFPGQGVRWEGVAERLGDHRDHRLLAELNRRTGVNDWSAVDPADTRLVQVAILTGSLLALSDELVQSSAAVVGHSFGELAALVAARVIGESDALDLAELRGRLGAEVQQHHGGAMLALVSVSAWQVERLRRFTLAEVGGSCEVAVLNHDQQVVLSGTPQTIDAVAAAAAAEGLRVHRLPIGGPYHTPAMSEAARAYTAAARQLDLQPPRVPVVISTATQPVASADDLADVPQRLGDSLVMPVDWPRTLALVRAMGATRGLDVGPGNVLGKIGRRAGLAFDTLWRPLDPTAETSRS